MLETLLMALIRLSGGRLAEVFLGIDSSGHATICDSQHVLYQIPDGSPHMHVWFRAWSTGGHDSTILSVSAKRLVAKMNLTNWESDDSGVLKKSGEPCTFAFILWPDPPGSPISYGVGDSVPFELQISRSWTKKLSVPVEAV